RFVQARVSRYTCYDIQALALFASLGTCVITCGLDRHENTFCPARSKRSPCVSRRIEKRLSHAIDIFRHPGNALERPACAQGIFAYEGRIGTLLDVKSRLIIEVGIAGHSASTPVKVIILERGQFFFQLSPRRPCLWKPLIVV